MADLMAGPNAPLSKAFIWCGWSTITVDWLLDASHDLSDPRRQESLHAQLQMVCFIAAALDCSTKSRAREIPRTFQDGRPAPKPLRSEEWPEGLPDLPSNQAQRVHDDNVACDSVLQEITELAQRGGTSLRENPWRSLHWHLPREKAMFNTGLWWDTHYASCVFAGARCKSQRLRHNVEEINAWPPLDCQHSHDPKEWDPYLVHGKAVFPSKEEAEYTAPLAFAIAVSVSWWACRMGKAKLHIPRMPAVERHGRREHWVGLDARSMRQWAMAPSPLVLGYDPLMLKKLLEFLPELSQATSFATMVPCRMGASTWAEAIIPIGCRLRNGRLRWYRGSTVPMMSGCVGMWTSFATHLCGTNCLSYRGRHWCVTAPGNPCVKLTS